jgi:hypothetical protein
MKLKYSKNNHHEGVTKMRRQRVKGLKKACMEAKNIPAGCHKEMVYNTKKNTIDVLPRILKGTTTHSVNKLPDDEQIVLLFPGDTMEEIEMRIYYTIFELEVLD